MWQFIAGALVGATLAVVTLAALAYRRLRRRPGAQLAVVAPAPRPSGSRRDPVELKETAVAVLNADDPARRRVIHQAQGAPR